MSSEKPLVYLILGAAGSGRREILADLIGTGLGESDRAAVLLAESETADERDRKFPAVARWRCDDADSTITVALPSDATHVFFLTDGHRNPVDQVEAFAAWLRATGGALARILCIVDCRLAEKNPPLLAWYDACVHFADVVLLNHREGVANKWMSDFLRRYTGQFYPCLIEPVKTGRAKNPALVLEPEARRMSHLFDEEALLTSMPVEEFTDDDTAAEDAEHDESADEDPYLVRDAAGRRRKRIPDITRFLG